MTKKVELFEWACGRSILQQYGYEHKQKIPAEDLYPLMEIFLNDGVQVMVLPHENGYTMCVDDKYFRTR